MIYTLTLNPSLDYILKVTDFRAGIVNRTGAETILPGGKGINVSWMLKNLGVPTEALGFLAGFTGEEIRKRVRELGIEEGFLMLTEGISRINVKIKGEEETEINGMGPVIEEKAICALLSALEKRIEKGDILVLSGSIPKTLPSDIYGDILARFQGKGIRFAVDTSGKAILSILQYRPFLIKPNHHELSELFGVSIETKEQAALYAEKLRKMGAENVLVSMAEKGAVLVCEEGVFDALAVQGEVVSSVGAGDSMVAGFLAGLRKDSMMETALRYAVAAGSATAFSKGIAERLEVENLLRFVEIEQK